MKKAFTLIELLVVIAIIAILAAVMMGTFSGGTESAKTARCLSNMRNLAAACQSAGVAIGHYPPAGSVETIDIAMHDGKGYKQYYEVQGWISWNSQGRYKPNPTRPYQPTSHQQNENVSMYSTDKDARLYALTNGAVWKYVSGNESVYKCPLHANNKKQLDPAWSYVMNAKFMWDRTKGKGSYPYHDWGGYQYGKLKRADRILLFAEIQFMEDKKNLSGISDIPEDTSGTKTDAILQYQNCLGGGDEMIGFNHKSGKRYCANVAFADGHIEKLLYPKDMGAQEIRDLTEWLCTGIDVSFDGKHYEKMDK